MMVGERRVDEPSRTRQVVAGSETQDLADGVWGRDAGASAAKACRGV